MTEEQAKRICLLFIGGSCPHSYSIDDGYTEVTTEQDNKDCCEYHYHPDDDDIGEMFGKGE